MTEGDMLMLRRHEIRRLEVVRKVIKERMRQAVAADLLELSTRQTRRIVLRVKQEGESGVIHRLRGRESNRRTDDEEKAKVLKLYKDKYEGFGPTLFCEKLVEIHKIRFSDETVRKWLLKSGDWEKSSKRRKHRQWRERKEYYGQLQQVDGSHHDWLEGRGAKMVLMAYIDDATGRVYCRFYKYEGTKPALDSFLRYIKKYGMPQIVYLDKHTTYKSPSQATIEQELSGEEPMSQFERALKELGVKVIHANSPQAKGRVERLFKTLQDRLVKEMRLKGIKTLEGANEFLKEYLPVLNRKFNVVARGKGDMHSSLPKGVDLDRILCIKTQRALRNDFTLVHDKKFYQVLDNTSAKTVMVEERVNGTMRIYTRDRSLKYKQLLEMPKKVEKIKMSELPFDLPRKKHIPAADHPWRQYRNRYSEPFDETNLADIIS